jgi:tetratricopeptide (TPR) repeat protein
MLFPIRLLNTLIFLSGLSFAQEGPDLETLAKSEKKLEARYEQSGGENDLWNWVESLAQLAWGHVEADRHEKAVRYYQRALDELDRKAVTGEPGLVAFLHDGLGRALQNSGELRKARPHLQEALRLRRAGKGVSEIQLGNSEGHLGLLELTLGHYREAGRLFHAALSHTPAGQKALLAHRHDCLGRYHLSLRAYRRAAECFENALELIPEDPDLRANLALSLFRNGETETALMMVEALKDGMKDQLRLATLLNLEATILNDTGDFDLAEIRLLQAIKILTGIRGVEHPSRASFLANLGVFRFEAGRGDDAIQPLTEARDLLKNEIEKHHQVYVEILYHLAACRPTRETIEEARRAAGTLLDKLVASGGERELLAFRSLIDLHSLACQSGDAGLIAESLFQGKGRILEAVLDRKNQARRTEGKRLELDRLLLRGEVGSTERIQKLREELEKLELIDRSSSTQIPDWRELARRLPERTVYVDLARYREGGSFRYGAVIFDRKALPRWVPLGSEKRCNRLALLQGSLRARADILRDGKGEAGMPMTRLLADLYRDFWQPVAEVLPEGTLQVILCPEGELHLAPWAVLQNKKTGHFLCEELSRLTVVDAGRRLLRKADPPVGFARPWQGFGVAEFSRQRAAPGNEDSPWSSSLEQLSDLPSVKFELETLRAIAPEGSGIFLNGRANQAALLEVSSPPAVLHLASHGFHHRMTSGAELAPFYESGIVMGAGKDHEEWLLFTDEAASLNLAGTQLVTLSTCRSASGRPVAGEGVMGLGRGFLKAGARNVMASLWEIPDESTGRLMKEYYQRLAGGKDSPSALLWKMQREHFEKLREVDPAGEEMEMAILSWGGFVVNSSEPFKEKD